MSKFTSNPIEKKENKMLYVFKVGEGRTLTFATDHATASVHHLQEEIYKVCQITPENQILICNGGDALEPSHNVGSYSTGVESNPIFLFSIEEIESEEPPTVAAESVGSLDLQSKIAESLEMPDSFTTIRSRSALSKLFLEIDEKYAQVCQTLIRDQHLQHQGWQAVIANLEEHYTTFAKNCERYFKEFEDFKRDRDSYTALIECCENDIQDLRDLKILPKLSELASQISLDPINTADLDTSTNLYDWLVSQDVSEKKNSLETLPKTCQLLIEKYNDRFFESLLSFVNDTIREGKNEDMKKIKGVSSRLQKLDQLLVEADQYVKAQKEMVYHFSKQEQSAIKVRDTSDLKEFCTSQREQLKLMLGNHDKLVDIHRRCLRAKQELGSTIHHSLKWLSYVQNNMTKASRQMYGCKISIDNLKAHLQRMQQIHLVPATYLEAVYEVVRRRAFSQASLTFASELACHLSTIYNEELCRRNNFLIKFDNTFLDRFFPGMHDKPPPYGIEAPEAFDTHLPKLTMEDIEEIKRDLPELTKDLLVPDIEAIANLFVLQNFARSDPDSGGIEEKITQVVNEVGLSSMLDQNLLKAADSETCLTSAELPLIKESEKGCESETDTEEFEKVSQNPIDLNIEKDTLPSPKMQHAATLTEENLDSMLKENTFLKNIIKQMGAVSRDFGKQWKLNIDSFRSWIINEKENIEAQCNSLGNSWENLAFDIDAREREICEKISLDYKDDLKDLRSANERYKQKILELENANLTLDNSLHQRIQQVFELNQLLANVREERDRDKQDYETSLSEITANNDKALKDLNDKLIAEKEMMKSRFNLMTQTKIPYSLSESNLEGGERSEVVDASKRLCTVSQILENRDTDIKKAIKETYRRLGSLYIDSLVVIKSNYSKSSTAQESDTYLIQKLVHLEEENLQLKQNLTEAKKSSSGGNFMKSTLEEPQNTLPNSSGNVGEKSVDIEKTLQRIELLEFLRNEFEADLVQSKRDRSVVSNDNEMAASVSVCSDSTKVKTSEEITKNALSQAAPIKISIDTCNNGDYVLVLWDPQYSNYIIVQNDSKHLYFLHSDSLDLLGLDLKKSEKKAFAVGEVVYTQHCQARKVENRYHVPKGTKFLRVKVNPLPKDKRTKPLMSQSEIVNTSNSQLDSSVPRNSLPSTPSKQSTETKLFLNPLEKSIR